MQTGTARFSTFRSLARAFALATVAASAAMASDVTFAQYDQVNGATEQWTITTSGSTTTVTASGSVYFIFSGVAGFNGPELATFSLTATSNTTGDCATNCSNGDTLTQAGYSGSFSFTDNEMYPGANLLSGVFQVVGNGAQFAAAVGSTGGSFDASATSSDLNQLVLSSHFLNFVGQTQEDASWSLSSLLPNFAVGAITTNSSGSFAYPGAGPFDASGTGTFSSNPGPTNASPEPASFALIGGGLLGLGLLRRKRATV